MKERAERLAKSSISEILSVIGSQRNSISDVLDEMEATHSGSELAQSRHYCALVSAFSNLRDTEECIAFWLNREISTGDGAPAVAEVCGEKVLTQTVKR